MKPGRELDALVAEKAMGWKRWPVTEFLSGDDPLAFPETKESVALMPPAFKVEDAQPPRGATLFEALKWKLPEFPEIPHYSTEISAAWNVVERMRGKTFNLQRLTPMGGSTFFRAHIEESGPCDADTAPHAICLAALSAIQASSS